MRKAIDTLIVALAAELARARIIAGMTITRFVTGLDTVTEEGVQAVTLRKTIDAPIVALAAELAGTWITAALTVPVCITGFNAVAEYAVAAHGLTAIVRGPFPLVVVEVGIVGRVADVRRTTATWDVGLNLPVVRLTWGAVPNYDPLEVP
jgi:hypothetical protein